MEAPSPQSNETELAKAKWRPEDLPSRESAKIEHLKVYDAKWTVGPTRHTDLAPAVPQSFRTNLENFGVEYLHPVQHLAYKHIFAGKSMLLSAPPSSGKTLAYLLPTLWKCTTREEEDESEGWPKRSGFCKPEGLSEVPFKDAATPRAVIVVPTRESADAVHMEARRFLMNAKAPLRICKVLGGVAMEEEVEDLATGCDLLIGTMGRLREYIDAPGSAHACRSSLYACFAAIFISLRLLVFFFEVRTLLQRLQSHWLVAWVLLVRRCPRTTCRCRRSLIL